MRHDLEQGLEESLYLVVGLAVLGLQQARSRARQLAQAPVPARLAGVGAALAGPILEPLRALLDRARTPAPGAGD